MQVMPMKMQIQRFDLFAVVVQAHAQFPDTWGPRHLGDPTARFGWACPGNPIPRFTSTTAQKARGERGRRAGRRGRLMNCDKFKVSSHMPFPQLKTSDNQYIFALLNVQ